MGQFTTVLMAVADEPKWQAVTMCIVRYFLYFLFIFCDGSDPSGWPLVRLHRVHTNLDKHIKPFEGFLGTPGAPFGP